MQMHAKPKGGARTSKSKDTLANRKPVEKWKWHIIVNGTLTAMAQHNRESFQWIITLE